MKRSRSVGGAAQLIDQIDERKHKAESEEAVAD